MIAQEYSDQHNGREPDCMQLWYSNHVTIPGYPDACWIVIWRCESCFKWLLDPLMTTDDTAQFIMMII